MKKIFVFMTILVLFFTCIFAKPKTKPTKEDTSFEDLKERGVFVLGLDDSFPPMGYRDEKNEIVGFDIDLAKEVAVRLGVQFKAQPVNWDSKEQELIGKKIDCIWNGLTITGERMRAMCLTKPYLENKQVVVVRKDSEINSITDLAGKTIALQQGSSAEVAVDDMPDFKDSLKEIIPLEQNLMALNDLVIGGVDAVVVDSIVAEYTLKTSSMPLRILDFSLASEKYGIAFRKSDKKLADGVWAILEEMAADGTVATISKKWFDSDITTIGK